MAGQTASQNALKGVVEKPTTTMAEDLEIQNEIDSTKLKTEIQLKNHANNIEKNDIPSNDNVSVVHHVKSLIKNGGRFEVNNFTQNRELNVIIRQVLGKEYNPNTEIPLDKVQQITSLYMQKVMEIQLRKNGKWQEFTKSFTDYKNQFHDFWNMERIRESFDIRGKNAMTIAGVTYGMTTLLGLGGENSKWYKELTNLSAYKKSGGKKWKMFLSAGIGAQIAGVPLAETAGLFARGSFKALTHVASTGAAIFANLFNPERWSEIIGGKNIAVPTPTEMLMLLPSIKNYFEPKYQKLLSQFYTAETGKDINISPEQIKDIAYLTVTSADNLFKQGDSPNLLNAQSWKNASIRNITDISAFYLATNPNQNIRKQFEAAINENLKLQREKKLKPLVGIINDSKFDADFGNFKTQILSKMTVKEKKSIFQAISTHGWSGLLIMTWVFIEGTLLATHLGMKLGAKVFGKSESKEEPDKRLKSGTKINEILNRSDDDLDKLTKKDWKEFVQNIKTAEVTKVGVISKLKSLGKKDFRNILKKLKAKGFSIKSSEDLREFAKMQALFKEVVNGVKKKTISENPLGSIEKRKGALRDLVYFDKAMEKFINSGKINYELSANGLFKTMKNYLVGNPIKFAKKRGAWVGKRFSTLKKGKLTITGAANSIFRDLGVPESRLKVVNESDKADKNRVIEIRKLIEDVLNTYNYNSGKSVLKDIGWEPSSS